MDACHNNGITPILLTQATLVSWDNSQEERGRIQHALKYSKLTHEGLVRAYEEIYEILHSVGKKKDALILDLASHLNGQGDFI